MGHTHTHHDSYSLARTPPSQSRNVKERNSQADRVTLLSASLCSAVTAYKQAPASLWRHVKHRPISHIVRHRSEVPKCAWNKRKRISGPKRDEVTGGWRKLHSEELHNLYSSPKIITMTKSRRMRWEGHVARMGGRGTHICY
jgi:hypothetical protein